MRLRLQYLQNDIKCGYAHERVLELDSLLLETPLQSMESHSLHIYIFSLVAGSEAQWLSGSHSHQSSHVEEEVQLARDLIMTELTDSITS